MSADEHRPILRLDGDALVRAIRDAGGPTLNVREPMLGGSLGAFAVARDDGTEWILTVAPPMAPGETGSPFHDAASSWTSPVTGVCRRRATSA